VQLTRQAADRPGRGVLAKPLAALGASLPGLGIMAGPAWPAVPLSAVPLLPGSAGTALTGGPAGLRAAIGKSLGLAGTSVRYGQQAELTGSGGGFGLSVALSAAGTTALIGTPERNLGAGAAYVFTLRHGTWSRTAQLSTPRGVEYEAFGKTVALSAAGSTALVGMPGRETVDVFTVRHGSWALTAEITGPSSAADGGFGDPLALSAAGSTALIGAPNLRAGAGYVFTLRGGSWVQTAELTAANAAAGSSIGSALALSAAGSTALIGAPDVDSQAGAVYVYTLRGGRWAQTAELTAAKRVRYSSFGLSVALSAAGTTALAGSGAELDIGAGYVFTLRGGRWAQTAELTASDGAPQDAFGTALALSASGNTAIAGAPFRGKSIGAVYLFTRRGRTWSQSAEFTDPHAAQGNEFGSSLAVSGTGGTALAAAPYRNAGAGAVYVFTERGTG